MSVIYPLGCVEDMSEGEYQAMWDVCNEASGSPPSSLNEKVGHWRTRKGAVLKIADMASAHIVHAINAFDRAGWGDHPKIRELREELARRGTDHE